MVWMILIETGDIPGIKLASEIIERRSLV